MRSSDIFPAYAGGQGYARSDTPSVLGEGGMPLLAPMIGIVAGDDVSGRPGQSGHTRNFQARKGDYTVLARRRGIIEIDEDLLDAKFEGVVAVQVGNFVGEIKLVLWPADTILTAIPQAIVARENTADLRARKTETVGAGIYTVTAATPLMRLQDLRWYRPQPNYLSWAPRLPAGHSPSSNSESRSRLLHTPRCSQYPKLFQ